MSNSKKVIGWVWAPAQTDCQWLPGEMGGRRFGGAVLTQGRKTVLSAQVSCFVGPH